ncbi:CRISPR-associated helicase Cas3' [Desulfofundulus sp.]|uniref:CRISPR-associated helicase Cas3' n=1 Tax=Desulfofundulus sp. TaxID=2282750 RepID=UPI003C77E2AD
MTNLTWPVWLDDVWAKSPQEEGESGESLALHTWHVLNKLSEMIQVRPRVPRVVNFPRLWHCLFWASWLHDFGKAARGFQKYLRGGPRWPHRHEVLSLAFLDWFCGGFEQEELTRMAAAIVYHHKDSREISLLYMGASNLQENTVGSLTEEVSDSVLEGLWRWLVECSVSWITVLGLSTAGIQQPELIPLERAITEFRSNGQKNIYRRLAELRRWGREVNRYEGKALSVALMVLRGHLLSSDHTASANTDSLLPVPLVHTNDLLARWGLPEAGLYPHQKACLKTRGEAVLVAPTGSGKTEAALLWACSQAGVKPLPRLFYTLPYQASMNAMYNRLQKIFPGVVGLEHGRATLSLYHRFLEEDYDRRQAKRMAQCAMKLSRLYYYPVRVLSPYQMLKGPYRLKGYEMLLSDFLGSAFIFDEIHAYEVERLAMILATVKYLRENFGATFLIMSATLPGLLERRLSEALGEMTTIRATPEIFAQFQRHRLLVQEGELLQDPWLDRISSEAGGGRSILVCCNTVKRAQQTYDELFQRLKDRAELVLLHGRFNSRDRLFKERMIQEATGSRSTVRRPVVLVATQVVEVSLDIDLDVIYSDPAPLDALVQRFGRINRRRLKKCAPVNVFTSPADGQQIYDKVLVEGTLAVLKKNAEKVIDEAAITSWLDEIYRGDYAQQWDRIYQEARERFENACLRSLRPFDSSEELEEMFYQAFNSIEVLPACLEQEYQNMISAGEPMEAAQLLVPLSWGQFCRLKKMGMVKDKRDREVYVVDVTYDKELGLQVR